MKPGVIILVMVGSRRIRNSRSSWGSRDYLKIAIIATPPAQKMSDTIQPWQDNARTTVKPEEEKKTWVESPCPSPASQDILLRLGDLV